jgi:hypothetical protein
MSCQPIVASPRELLSDSFPYVLWPLKPLVYHIQTLPSTIERQLLREWLAYLSRALRRRCALVLGAQECIYFEADGTHRWSTEPPTGGFAFQADVAIPEPPR